MTKRELSKYDFYRLTRALSTEEKLTSVAREKRHLAALRELIELAHTGWLEIEDE